MNGQEIFLGLSYISRKYIEEAETETVSGGRGKAHRIRRPFLLAAVIALLLLLVGCAAVYVLKMEHVKISSGTDQRDYSLVDGVYVKDPHTVSTTTLSMAGLKGSNAYKACADFYAYETELRASKSESGDWTGYERCPKRQGAGAGGAIRLKAGGTGADIPHTRNCATRWAWNGSCGTVRTSALMSIRAFAVIAGTSSFCCASPSRKIRAMK